MLPLTEFYGEKHVWCLPSAKKLLFHNIVNQQTLPDYTDYPMTFSLMIMGIVKGDRYMHVVILISTSIIKLNPPSIPTMEDFSYSTR